MADLLAELEKLSEKWPDSKVYEHRIGCQCAACWARQNCAKELHALITQARAPQTVEGAEKEGK
jgi:hypothetical protein